MPGLTDDKAALIAMNKAMQQVTEQMGRLAVSAGMASKAMEQDFTRQFADFHWALGAVLDTLPYTGKQHGGNAGGPYFAGMEANALRGTPPSTSAPPTASGQQPSAPENIQPRRYGGMGGLADPFPHLGAKWATGYLFHQLLTHGNPDMFEGMGKLHAHLQGGREMQQPEFHALYTQAFRVKDEEGKRLFSDAFLKKMAAAARMARTKYEHARSYPADSEATRQSIAQRQRTKELEQGTTALKKFRDVLTGDSAGAKQFAKSAFQYGGVSLEAVSPDAFATLTGSFKLLAAVVGSELVPYSLGAALHIQQLAHALEGMDRQKKAWLGLASALGLAAAGAVVLAPQLVAVAKIMSALKVGTLLKGTAGFLVTHPALAGVGVAAGAGLGLYAYMQHNAARLEDFQKRQAELKSTHNAKINSRTGLEGSLEYMEVEKMAPAERNAFILQKIRENTDKAETERGNKMLLEGTHPEHQGLLGKIRGMYNVTISPDELMQHAEKERGYRNKAQTYTLLYDYFNRKGAKEAMRQGVKETPAQKQLKDDQIMATAPLLHAFQSRVQPAYYGVEDMYKRIQLSALAESPLDQEIRRIQLEQLDKLSKGNGFLEQMVSDLKTALGMGT